MTEEEKLNRFRELVKQASDIVNEINFLNLNGATDSEEVKNCFEKYGVFIMAFQPNENGTEGLTCDCISAIDFEKFVRFLVKYKNIRDLFAFGLDNALETMQKNNLPFTYNEENPCLSAGFTQIADA